MAVSQQMPFGTTTSDSDALRQALREALAAYREAEDERHLLVQQQAVRPWTPEQASRAATVARETAARLERYERLARQLGKGAA